MIECWNHEPVWIQTQKYIASSSEGLVPRFLQILEKYLFIRLLMFDTIIALWTTVQITGCWVIWPVFPFTVSQVALFFFLKAPVFIGQSEHIYWT